MEESYLSLPIAKREREGGGNGSGGSASFRIRIRRSSYQEANGTESGKGVGL